MISAWKSADKIVKVGSVFALAVPYVVMSLFFWTQRRYLLPFSPPSNASQMGTTSRTRLNSISRQNPPAYPPGDNPNDRTDTCWCRSLECTGGELAPLLVLSPGDLETIRSLMQSDVQDPLQTMSYGGDDVSSQAGLGT